MAKLANVTKPAKKICHNNPIVMMHTLQHTIDKTDDLFYQVWSLITSRIPPYKLLWIIFSHWRKHKYIKEVSNYVASRADGRFSLLFKLPQSIKFHLCKFISTNDLNELKTKVSNFVCVGAPGDSQWNQLWSKLLSWDESGKFKLEMIAAMIGPKKLLDVIIWDLRLYSMLLETLGNDFYNQVADEEILREDCFLSTTDDTRALITRSNGEKRFWRFRSLTIKEDKEEETQPQQQHIVVLNDLNAPKKIPTDQIKSLGDDVIGVILQYIDYLSFIRLILCNRWWFNYLSIPHQFDKLPALKTFEIKARMMYQWDASISSYFYFQLIEYLLCFVQHPWLCFFSSMPKWILLYVQTFEGSHWMLGKPNKLHHANWLQNILLYKLPHFHSWDDQVQVYKNMYYYKLKTNLLNFGVKCKNIICVRSKLSSAHLHSLFIKEYVSNVIFWFGRIFDDSTVSFVDEARDEETFAVSSYKRLVWIHDEDFDRLHFMFGYQWLTSRVVHITLVLDWSTWGVSAENTMNAITNPLTFPLLKNVELIGVYHNRASFEANARMWSWLERNLDDIIDSQLKTFELTIFKCQNDTQPLRCMWFDVNQIVSSKQIETFRMQWMDLIVDPECNKCDVEGIELWNEIEAMLL